MKNSYFDLINQSYQFPQDGFDLRDGNLEFHGVSIKGLIDQYGTPFKLMYLPRIGEQISKARDLFHKAMQKHDYNGMYHYAYCTKSCHYAHVLRAAAREGVQLETSSAFDIDLIYKLLEEGEINKDITIIHNGFKTDGYLQRIANLNKEGFTNSILVLDSISELSRVKLYSKGLTTPIQLGIRIAIDGEPQSAYFTSRLGIRPTDILSFYEHEIKDDPSVELKMMHFFIDTGIKDNMYYWGEFQKALNLFVALKKVCPNLNAIDLGGGFPIRNNLGFEYDYEHIIDEIVGGIKSVCVESRIEEPDIYTEFGKYTVGESGAIILSVLEQKQQNDAELWYMVDNSLLNTIPDSLSIFEKFIMLPINKWNNEYSKVNIGGISCDHTDYYNSEDMNQQLVLPTYDSKDAEPLYVGFFHTGAYQDAISGYGGIKHCLIPSPKVIVIDKNENGNFVEAVINNEQSVDEMLETLGF